MKQKPLPATTKWEEMPEQTLPFGITSCPLLKCTCRRGLGSWYKSLRSCWPFCMGRELALLIRLFPLAHEQREKGRTSPKERRPVQEAGPVQPCVSSSFGRGYVKFGQHFCESCILWAEILSTEWQGGKKTTKKKKSVLKSFQFLPVCSKGQIGSFSLLTV